VPGQADGHMHRHLRQTELARGLEPRVADDDDALFVHHNRLAKAERADGIGYGVHGGVVETRVVLVRADAVDRAKFNVHDQDLLFSKNGPEEL
jgi:hypothetical protein